MSRRITITTTAKAWIEEIWDLDVPDDFPEVTLERVGDPDDPIDLNSLLQDPRVTFVGVDDRVLGDEQDREVRTVTEVSHEEALEDGWQCPGCHQTIQPSDVRRHAADCDKYDGRFGY